MSVVPQTTLSARDGLAARRGTVNLTQRHLVNRRLRLADGEVVTKYAFPFWDSEWKVALFVVDRLGKGPAILHPPVHGENDGSVVSKGRMAEFKDLASIEPGDFHRLFHYDPWWVFRGMAGVSDEMKQAILPTNISKPFRRRDQVWKVHDVDVGDRGAEVVAIVAKNEMFERRHFTREDLDLVATWPKALPRTR